MGENGLGAIAVTDHLCESGTWLGKAARLMSKTLIKEKFRTYIQEIQLEADRAMKQYGMLVLPGIEITKNSLSHKNSAHILAIDIHEYIDPDMPIKKIIDAIHGQGGLAIAAHPVSTGKAEHQTRQLWNARDEFQNLFDAWEVASGRKIFTEVRDSGLPMIANSDLHQPEQIESWKTVMTGSRTAKALKESVISQNLAFEYFSARSAVSFSLKRTSQML